MYNSVNTSRPFSMKLALVSAAVGASFAAPAQATVISTVPAGFTPVIFKGLQSSSYDIDIDRNGVADFKIATGDNQVYVAGVGTNTVASFIGYYAGAYSDPTQFLSASSLKTITSAVLIEKTATNLSVVTPYVQLKLADQSNGPTGGYLKGTTGNSSSGEAIFTLLDFGVVTADVPEPGSLALLAAGAAGIGALRRRRRPARAI